MVIDYLIIITKDYAKIAYIGEIVKRYMELSVLFFNCYRA